MDQPSAPKPDKHLATFAAMLEVPGLLADIFPPALQITAIVIPAQPTGWLSLWQSRLDRLVGEVGAQLPAHDDESAAERFARFGRHLFQERGFSGNLAAYADPRNSCLTEVLERRLGIPITLSVLAIAIGRRLGMKVHGVAAPGHFLTALEVEPGRRVFMDPFNRGQLVHLDEARERVRAYAGNVDLDVCDHFLRPASPRDILARMLQNLKNSYALQEDMEGLLRTLDWLLVVQPANVAEIRNRGLLLLRMGDFARAVRDLAFYIHHAPEADDSELIRAELRRAMTAKARNN
ncbi:MAG: transglutaminase-like domain-containing protein [Candidatus Sumerlaeia bacterium]|nr:transglutaminase-like domain-containing protein [Candidatus Sumerlaeia bacterium]